MAQTDRDTRRTLSWDRLTMRARAALGLPSVPDYAPEGLDRGELRHQRLDRMRNTLEATRARIEVDGWTRGAWFTVRHDSGGVQAIGGSAARTLTGQLHRSTLNGCLVGTMLKLAEDPDTPYTHRDVWQCVDELYESMREGSGHESYGAGRVSSPTERRVRLRALTAWNDAPRRTRQDVLALLDRSISRTIVAACDR